MWRKAPINSKLKKNFKIDVITYAPDYNVPPFWHVGQGGHSCLLVGLKNKLGKGRWDLVSCRVLLNSVKRFQRRSRKCLCQSDAGWQSCFPIYPTNTTLVKDVEILLPDKYRWIPFSVFREVENVSANQRQGSHLVFPIHLKNTNFVEDVRILLPVKFR